MSEQATHTPGPWHWTEHRERDGYSGLVGDDGKREVLFPDCANDGDNGAAWFEEYPTEHDARLISAAPELLAACELTVTRHDALRCKGAIPDCVSAPIHVVLARAAIAKAKGEATANGEVRDG